METEIEIQPLEVVSEREAEEPCVPVIEEKLPPVTHLRIIYAAAKVTENDDPFLQAVANYAAKIYGVVHFRQENGDTGTAFFCEMKEDWKPPTAEQAQENVKKLDEPVPNQN